MSEEKDCGCNEAAGITCMDHALEKVGKVGAVAEEAVEQPLATGTSMFMPTPGWAIQQPPAAPEPPQNGAEEPLPAEPAWLLAFGIFATGHGADGFVPHSVVVLMPDQTLHAITMTPGIKWSPARPEVKAQPGSGIVRIR